LIDNDWESTGIAEFTSVYSGIELPCGTRKYRHSPKSLRATKNKSVGRGFKPSPAAHHAVDGSVCAIQFGQLGAHCLGNRQSGLAELLQVLSDHLGVLAFYAFLITLKKSDSDYSPTTMYRDFTLSPSLFHWESQSTTSSTSPTGQRYIHHRERGSHILLFVRQAKTNALGTSPYVFLGPADYVAHEGDRPMAITWRLRQPMPTEVYQASTVAVA
jgi:Domain of unknown function (DUF3427)